MSGLQFDVAGAARALSLLVWQGCRPKTHRRPSSPHLRTDMFEISRDMPAPMLANVPRRALPALHIDGPDSDLLLRQEHFHQAVQRDGLRKGLELPGTLWRSASLRRALLHTDLPCRALWFL